MANDKLIKVLVCGDVEGQFRQLFSRVAAINKKNGPFEMLLCVGDFFCLRRKDECDDLLHGRIDVTVPTYILGPNQPDHVPFYESTNEAEICKNVIYLGKRGMFTSSLGCKLAYFSGIEKSVEQSNGDVSFQFTSSDAQDFLFTITQGLKFKGVDIFLTSSWPRGISKFAMPISDFEDNANLGSPTISQLALALKPRYHFAGLEGIHYERQPYRNHKVLAESSQHVTRFIGLAQVGNLGRKKFIYAFNLVPMKHADEVELVKQPLDVTECPYTYDKSILADTKAAATTQFFYDTSTKATRETQQGHKRAGDQLGTGTNKRKPPSGPCWFCLGSKEVEKHLVVSVGASSYLALAKGGLVPDHILILPVGHFQSTVRLPDDVSSEIERYKSVVADFFAQRNKAVVFFERNYKTQHLQIQVVPYPVDKKPVVKETIQNVADSQGIDLKQIPSRTDLRQVLPTDSPYFLLELDTGEKYFCRIQKSFPLQFGREILASPPLLDMPDRVDWKSCSLSKEEETRLASLFKKSFQPYDFNFD